MPCCGPSLTLSSAEAWARAARGEGNARRNPEACGPLSCWAQGIASSSVLASPSRPALAAAGCLWLPPLWHHFQAPPRRPPGLGSGPQTAEMHLLRATLSLSCFCRGLATAGRASACPYVSTSHMGSLCPMDRVLIQRTWKVGGSWARHCSCPGAVNLVALLVGPISRWFRVFGCLPCSSPPQHSCQGWSPLGVSADSDRDGAAATFPSGCGHSWSVGSGGL